MGDRTKLQNTMPHSPVYILAMHGSAEGGMGTKGKR